MVILARPHLLSSPPGEERADDGFEFSSGGSANSDAGHLVRRRMILPLLRERAVVREDECRESSSFLGTAKCNGDGSSFVLDNGFSSARQSENNKPDNY
jgi:hypothetical protein